MSSEALPNTFRVRALDERERAVLAALPSEPRSLPCSSCAGAPMRDHEIADVEVTASAVVRWWRCTVCRTARSLDVIARPVAPGAVAA